MTFRPANTSLNTVVSYSNLFMLYDVSGGMWDVGDVMYWGYGMLGLWDMGEVECSGCGMLEMWDVGDVRC